MKNIVFFCNKKIGLDCLKYTFKKKKILDIKIIAVFTRKNDFEIKNFCKKNNILVCFDIKKISKFENLDIGISIQYHIIFNKKIISNFKNNLFNLHMAPLPEYRGCNQFSFAIINEENTFGTSIHAVDEGVDSGPILFQKRFKISKKIWVKDLYDLTCQHSYKLFTKSINSIIFNKYTLNKQVINSRIKNYFYLRSDINKIKKINLSWDKEKIEKYIRATSMPDFDPPYMIVKNKLFKINI